jgi:probable DNA repair protein
LRDGAEIVTANRRFARELRRVFADRQLAAGRTAWRTPPVMPWEAWLNRRLETAVDGAGLPRRLSGQASAVLWERCLGDVSGLDVLDPQGLVRHARRCWERLNEWCVPVEELARRAANDDERRFAAAAAGYLRALGTNGWVDAALVPALVAERLSSGGLTAPRRLVLAGFDRPTPAVRRVIAAMEAQGCRVSSAPVPTGGAAVRVVDYADRDAELRAAGWWARERLAADPHARIAVVYPGLEQDAARVERLVREGFARGWQSGGSRHTAAVQISYGRRLADYPLIARGLLWLRWSCQGLTSREVSLLLRAPFAAGGAGDGCSRLELELRRLPDRLWSATSLARALRDRDAADDAQTWLARVDIVAASGLASAPAEPPAVWAQRIHQLLGRLGWPGEGGLDSAEFQLVDRWRELLNEFTRIEPARPRLGFREALARVRQAAGEAVFQPESGPGAVQILGTLEAQGLEFDQLWIGNLTAAQWPPPQKPLPLVSRELQRRLGMPDATPSDTLDFARRSLSRLLSSASSVVLSWPAADMEAPQAPSPLLDVGQPHDGDHHSDRLLAAADPGWYAASLPTPGVLETIANDPAPRVRPDERIRGGARTVQQQATEPFSAFARGRLGVRELETIAPGLSPSAGGRIVHAALHRLLAAKPTSAELAGWSPVERASRIERAIDLALEPEQRHADAVLHRLFAFERTRLERLLDAFLDAELSRRAFSIDSVEADMRLVAHGVTLHLRVDRIDRLSDGSLLVMDYKTGAVKHLVDRGGAPVDLQLAVYASAIDGPIAALVLVNIGGTGVLYRGVGSGFEWHPLEPGVWQERLDDWKRKVDAAMAAFADGDLGIDVGRPADDGRALDLLSRAEELRRER